MGAWRWVAANESFATTPPHHATGWDSCISFLYNGGWAFNSASHFQCSRVFVLVICMYIFPKTKHFMRSQQEKTFCWGSSIMTWRQTTLLRPTSSAKKQPSCNFLDKSNCSRKVFYGMVLARPKWLETGFVFPKIKVASALSVGSSEQG